MARGLGDGCAPGAGQGKRMTSPGATAMARSIRFRPGAGLRSVIEDRLLIAWRDAGAGGTAELAADDLGDVGAGLDELGDGAVGDEAIRQSHGQFTGGDGGIEGVKIGLGQGHAGSLAPEPQAKLGRKCVWGGSGGRRKKGQKTLVSGLTQ